MGEAQSLLQVKEIVGSVSPPLVVVVSALGGVTDQLISMTHSAKLGETSYERELNALASRHYEMVKAVVPQERRVGLRVLLDELLSELRSILHGLCLIQDLTPKTADAIVSYGERLSSLILTAALPGAKHYEARNFIKTTRKGGRNLVDFSLTGRLVRETFEKLDHIAVVGGFIASDAQTLLTTNLGRGGSDYTAALLASALEAERLEIWTDVDGFMTADPRIIPSAYTIEQLSYAEAMELCNFGAKVLFPPTIYPVCRKNIPIYIKNTFHPERRGTIICATAQKSLRPIRGISSVNSMTMVTVNGLSMVGVIGVNQRIFSTLASGGVSVFMVAQNASETSTSICVTPEQGERARQLLDKEFASEIAEGSMNPAILTPELASVAVVGEKMRRLPGIAGKLFTVLGQNGISVNAVAMGGQEMNLSFVIEKTQLRKTLNVLHDSLFLGEYEELNLFVCGTGTVGKSLLEQISAQREQLIKERRLKLNLVGVCTRSRGAYSSSGIDPAHYREALAEGTHGGIEHMLREVERMNIFNSVFVDCTASEEVAGYYARLLERNVSIVAANKIAASSSFENYAFLKQTAMEKGVKFLFETNVGAGLPIIHTIGDLLSSGDRVLKIEAVLSGTLNFVFNALSSSTPLSKAVKLAQESGFSEPDPRVDLSGKDVIRKLVILARESGYEVEVDQISKNLFIPPELFEGSLEAFWERLPELDESFEKERQRLLESGKRWRFVAQWADGEGSVGLKEIPLGHPLYDLDGSNNIVLLTTERYKEYPMLIQGYGAGAEVTAAGVFADILRVAKV